MSLSSISSQTSIGSMKKESYIQADVKRNSHMINNKLLLDQKMKRSSM